MKRLVVTYIISFFLILSCSGCATGLQHYYNTNHRQKIINRHPEWSEQAKADVLAGNLKIGMTKKQALAACKYPILGPTSKQKSTTTYGTREDWFWQSRYGNVFYHMSFDENGKLDYWSED